MPMKTDNDTPSQLGALSRECLGCGKRSRRRSVRYKPDMAFALFKRHVRSDEMRAVYDTQTAFISQCQQSTALEVLWSP